MSDILKKKAEQSESLNESLQDQPVDEVNDTEIKVVDKGGKKMLVFKDPLYSREKRSVVNYTIFRGKWEFEIMDDIDDGDSEKCAVKFLPTADSSNITITFKSIKDRLEFMDSIYADNEMRQMGTGMSLEKYANSKVLKTAGGLIGLSLAGIGLYQLFTKSKKTEDEK